MKSPYLHAALAVVLLAGVSGCAIGPMDISAPQVLLPEIPAPARVTLEALTAGGEIETLKRKETEGRAVYHIEARVGDEDVEYDIAGDGRVLAVNAADACTSLQGVFSPVARNTPALSQDLRSTGKSNAAKRSIQ